MWIMRQMSTPIYQAPSLSVRDILDQRGPGGWELALVQRDEVWDEVRTRQLLDSLVRGYPVGAILLTHVEEGGLAKGGHPVSGGRPLVLDGQQRMKALADLFSSGRYHLRITRELSSPEPRTTRSHKSRGLSHIHFDPHGFGETPEPHTEWLCLKTYAQWALATSDRAPHEGASDDDQRAWLASHQEALGLVIDPGHALTAVRLLTDLDHAMHEARIPVLTVRVKSPLDVLEVFTRVNMSGVQVTGTDVYFAGVKTFWPEAEQALAVFDPGDSGPFLATRAARLRFLSRLAAVGIGQADTLPLAVDRLAGIRGEHLQAAMRELAADTSPVPARLAAFIARYRHSTRLEHGVRLIRSDLFDVVLGWAAARPLDGDASFAETDSDLIDAFLLGASLTGVVGKFKDTFRRKAFLHAVAAGTRSEPFPLRTLAEVAHALAISKGPALPDLTDQDTLARVASDHGALLTTLIQRIKIDLAEAERFDWDHIIPHSHVRRMRIRGSSGRPHFHPYRRDINSAGNLWALGYSLNRSLQAASGAQKFDKVDDWRASPEEKFNDSDDVYRVLDPDQVSVTPDERKLFIEVDAGLGGNDDAVNSAMETFHSLTRSRMVRLLEDALDRFPEAALFSASTTDVEPVDQDPSRSGLAAYLGLTNPYANLRHASAKEARRTLRERGGRILALVADQLEAGQISKHWHDADSRVVAWYAIELTTGPCCELICKWTPEGGAELYFKAYARYRKSGDLYEDFDHLPLGADWDEPDASLVAAFVHYIARVEAKYAPGRP